MIFCLFLDGRCAYFIRFSFVLLPFIIRNASLALVHTFTHTRISSCANLNYGTVHSSSWNWFVQHLMFTAYCSACKQTLITIYVSAYIICACNSKVSERKKKRGELSTECAYCTHSTCATNQIPFISPSLDKRSPRKIRFNIFWMSFRSFVGCFCSGLFVCYSVPFPRCCQMIMDLRPLTAHKRSICLFLRVSSKTLRVKNRIYQFHVIICAAACFIAIAFAALSCNEQTNHLKCEYVTWGKT